MKILRNILIIVNSIYIIWRLSFSIWFTQQFIYCPIIHLNSLLILILIILFLLSTTSGLIIVSFIFNRLKFKNKILFSLTISNLVCKFVLYLLLGYVIVFITGPSV